MDVNQPKKDSTGEEPWFADKRFMKFWYHYNTMMMAAHRDAIMKANYQASQRKSRVMKLLTSKKGLRLKREKLGNQSSCSVSRAQSSCSTSRTHSSCWGGKTPSEIARTKRNKKKRRRKKRNRRLRELAKLNTQEGASDTEFLSQMSSGMKINDTDDDELGDVILNDDLLTFMETTHKHRLDWKLRKALLKKKEGGMLLMPVSMEETMSQEHPDVTRSREMKQLYGSVAPRIHAMETAIQLSFDRISTLHRPQYWPNIPLHVIF